jgi:integrase
MPYQRNGSRYHYITVAGVRRSSKTTNEKDAAALEHKLNHQAWLATHMGIKRPRSWQETVVKYLKEIQGQVNYKGKVSAFRWWERVLGTPDDIRTITRELVSDKLQGLVTVGPSPQNSTMNNRVAYLQTMLTRACKVWKWTDTVDTFERYKNAESKRKALSVEQWRTLHAALPDDLKDFFLFALATGLRSAKIQHLTWAQYEAPKRILHLTGLGNKRVNDIPLNDTAVGVLERIRHASPRHLTLVFPHLVGQAVTTQRWKTFQRLRELPGLEHIDVHSLRYTFSSWMGQNGIRKEVREILLGHAALDTNDIYTEFCEQALRPAVAVIDKVLNNHDEKVRSLAAN